MFVENRTVISKSIKTRKRRCPFVYEVISTELFQENGVAPIFNFRS